MVAVIDYGVGNLFSVEKALSHLGADVRVTKNSAEIEQASHILLPGVGAFGDCMRELSATGLIPLLKEQAEKKPFLGICVGLQLLFEGSAESEGVAGLGLFTGRVEKIPAMGVKIPQMGWNALQIKQKHPLFRGLDEESFVYFVHSYHAVPKDESIIAATVEYGSTLTAAVARGNLMATQFHPEKSGDVGLHLLKNFLDMK